METRPKSRVRLLLAAFVLILITLAMLSQIPSLYRRMTSESLPIGRFPLAGIRQTGGGGDLSDGWAAGHDGDDRGWLVSWSHIPGMPAQDEMEEIKTRGLEALASTDAGAMIVSDHAGRNSTEGDHRVIVERLRLHDELEAVQLAWGCPHGQRGVSVILWAPSREELPLEPEALVAGMTCHADGELSPAPALPILELPDTYRKQSDALQGSTYTTRKDEESVTLRGGFRWHDEKYPTLLTVASDGYWHRFMEMGDPQGRSVSLPDVPHPVWELTQSATFWGGRGSDTMMARLFLAYVWYCPSHDRVFSVEWKSPHQVGRRDYDRTQGDAPDFLRRVQCPEGCKG